MAVLEELVARLRLDTSGFQSAISGVSSSLASTGQKMRSTGRTMSTGLTLPLAGAGAAATMMAADFDKTMRQVAIATGGPADALRELAMQMGAETAFSAGEASAAMLELAKGGMTAAQIEAGALEATMKLASAGGVGLADSATYVSNAMGAFGLSAKDADSVTVALAGAANASSASVESLGQGLSQSALAAKNAGLSLQETTGVLSMFDAAGLKGADAGTSLKSMLASLTPSTAKARDAMNELGLSFVDREGNFRNIGDIAEQLRTKLGGLTEEQRAQRLETIFGSDGVRAASLLMDGGAKAVERYTKASRDSATTQKLANAAMEGTSGAIEKAKGSVETAAIVLGTALAPHVEAAAGQIERLANWFSELDSGSQKIVVGVGAAAAAIGPLGLALGGIAAGASALTSGVGLAARGVMGLGSVAGSAVTGMTNLYAGLSSSQAAASAFTGRMGTIGGALRSTAVAMTSATAAAARWAAAMVAAAARAAASMAATAARVVAAYTLMAARAMASAARMAAAWLIAMGPIGLVIAAVVAAVALIIKNWDSVRTFLVKLWAGIKSTAQSAWNGIKSTLSSAVNGIVSTVSSRFQQMRALIAAVWAAIRAAVASAWGAIRGAVSSGINAVRAAVSAGMAAVRSLMAAAWAAVRAAVAAAWAAIRGAVAAGISTMMGLLRGIPGQARAALGNLGGVLVGAGRALLDGLVAGIQSGIAKVQGILASVTDKIPDWKGPAKRDKVLLRPAGQLVMDGFIDGVEDRLDALKRSLENVTKKAKKAVEDRIEAWRELGQALTRRWVDGIDGGRDHVVDRFSSLMDALREVGNRGALGAAKEVRDHLMGLGADLDRYTKRLEAKTEALARLREQAAQYRDTIVSTFTETGDVTAITDGTAALRAQLDAAQSDLTAMVSQAQQLHDRIVDTYTAMGDLTSFKGATGEGGEALPVTFADIEAGLEDAAAEAQRFTDVMLRLQAAGLDQDAMDQLLAKGPAAALEAATAILAGGDAAVARVNALQAQIKAAGDALGDATAEAMYGAGLTAGEELVAGLTESLADVTLFDQMEADLEASADAARRFQAAIQALIAAGLNPTALQQLIDKGPEAGLAYAEALLAGGNAAVKRVNQLQAEIAAAGTQTAQVASQHFYGAGISAMQGLVNGLESQVGRIAATMQRIARRMVRALMDELDINSPSRVMAGLGEMTGAGFVQGLASMESQVAAASRTMAGAAVVGVQVPRVTGAAVARGLSGGAGTMGDVRVFIGDRELTDIVRVEVGGTLQPLRTLTRTGAY